MNIFQKSLALLVSLSLVIAAVPGGTACANQPAQSEVQPTDSVATQSPEELQQLVAPIALYPDSLVAQVLAASTFPEEIVEADRWLQSHPDLKGDALGQAVDQQPWDPSVKALTAFPSVLGNMDKNLSWTSSLGSAYYNQEQGVMDAVQVMRARAQEAGNLKSNQQEKVTTQEQTIVIEPAEPEVVYVPVYDPWVVYGAPVVVWPGWYWYPELYVPGPGIAFGVGLGVGFSTGFGWGWHHWGSDWGHHYAVHDHERYYSQSRTFYNRDGFHRGEGARGVYNRPERAPEPFAGNHGAARGYAEPRGQSEVRSGAPRADRGTSRNDAEPRGQRGVRSGAFSGFGSGGQERSFSSRGSASFGGGGGFHGGGRR
jgi:uncharacterized membrane protein YgcG